MIKYVQLDDGRCAVLVRRDSRNPEPYTVRVSGSDTDEMVQNVTFIEKDAYEAYKPAPVATTKKPARGKK